MHYFRQLSLLLVMLLYSEIIPVYGQEPPSSTPLVVILMTPTPFVERSVATITPTFTATALGLAQLEVRQEAGTINVRTEPGPEADQLGSISYGTIYPVYRQFYSWYEIQFELSPNGRGWIFGSLVDIIGDGSAIQIIDDFNWATPQGPFVPTATEVSELSEESSTTGTGERIIEIPTALETLSANEPSFEVMPLATYTYPPDVVAVAPTQSFTAAPRNTAESTAIAKPILPIILLGGLGIIGLLLNSLRS